MEISIADQIALDDALVAPADRLKIGKCNLRLSSDVTSKEATLQVAYDVLKLTPFYKAFQVSADVPEIYMQEFWATAYVHNRSVRFKMNNKKHILNLDQFRDILQICPKVGNKKFEEPPLEKEILAFLASLGHSGEIRKITDVNVNKLHQPWRSFAAIINKCLSGKPSYDSLRLSQAQILWGMYNKKNVDYAYLLWEDFIYQIENKNTKKGNAMYYPHEGTGFTPGDPDALYTQRDDISVGNQDDDDHDDDEKVQDDDEHDVDETVQEDDDEELTESDDDGDDFVHPKLTTHDDDIIHEEDTDEDDSRISSSDDEDSDNDVEGAKTDEEATYEEDQGNEADEDTNTDLDGRENVMTDVILTQVQATQETEDTHVTLTPVNPDGQQQALKLSLIIDSSQHANPNQDTELELKKILIDKMEANNSINRPWVPKKKKSGKEPASPSRLQRKLCNQTESLKDCRPRSLNGRVLDEQAEEEDPTFELMKAHARVDWNWNIFCEAGVYKATTEKLDWINPEGRQYPHDLRQPLLLVPNSQDLVPNSMWSQTIVKYDKFALWGISHWGKKRRQFYAFATSKESARDVYSKRRIIAVTKVEIVEWHDDKAA
ncbi:hypothetical protein Tco_0388780 [Tanacetum coccineum]